MGGEGREGSIEERGEGRGEKGRGVEERGEGRGGKGREWKREGRGGEWKREGRGGKERGGRGRLSGVRFRDQGILALDVAPHLLLAGTCLISHRDNKIIALE